MNGLRTVRARMTLWNVGVVALTLAGFGGVLQYSVSETLWGAVKRDLQERARPPQPRPEGPDGPPNGPDVRPMNGPFPGERGPDGPPYGNRPPQGNFIPQGREGGPEREVRLAQERLQNRPVPPLGQPGDGRPAPRFALPPRFLDTSGKDFLSHMTVTPWSTAAFQGVLKTGRGVFAQESLDDEPILVFARPIIEDRRIVGVMEEAAPVGETIRAVNGVTSTLLLMLPFALLIAGVGGALLTERALRPVRDITLAASHIEGTNLAERLPVHGEDEFARLAAVLNGMLERMESAFRRERRFTADASHELKTPLAIIKVNTSLALEDEDLPAEYAKTLRTIERASDRAERITRDLLTLARENGGTLPLKRETMLATDLCREAREAVGAEGQRVGLNVTGGVTLNGDRHQLVRLLVNLMTNALRHTPVPGRVTLSARKDRGGILLVVADTGEGIPPEHLAHLTEPFYRVDTARAREGYAGTGGGNGLGLTIAESIVRAHGGTLKIDSEVGIGTTVTVRLPEFVGER